MAKITIVDKAPTMKRYGDLASGELFYACGDIAIKTSNEWAIVLKDGNYVRRNDDDFVEVVEYAELHIGKNIDGKTNVSHRVPACIGYCKYLEKDTMVPGTFCSAAPEVPSVSCGGILSRCETGMYDSK